MVSVHCVTIESSNSIMNDRKVWVQYVDGELFFFPSIDDNEIKSLRASTGW